MLEVSALSVSPTRAVPAIAGSPLGAPGTQEMPTFSHIRQLCSLLYRQSTSLFSEPVQTTSSIKKTPLPFGSEITSWENPG